MNMNTRTIAKLAIKTAILPAFLFACSLSDIVEVGDPETGALDRDFVKSSQGAIGLFHASVGLLQAVTNSRNLEIGLFTDELTLRPYGTSEHNTSVGAFADPRFPTTHTSGEHSVEGIQYPSYASLQKARINAMQSRYFLKNMHNTSYDALIAGSYAIEGYTILIIAEDLCSGIPLSNVPAEGEVIYSGPVSTQDLFRTAVAKFDSSLQINHDSTKYLTLARIGKGRALMGMGEYGKAAEAVADIQPTEKFEFKYNETVITSPVNGLTTQPYRYWTWTPASPTGSSTTRSTEIINKEGQNGMVWYVDPLNIDPRVPVSTELVNEELKFTSIVRQRKYVGATLSFPIAKWAEAKMIEAESYLSDGDARWIEVINEARRSVGLPDTSSPSSIDEKVDLLFRERAYWFYGEGVRLADYRRLVRQYNRSPFSVYPTGGYARLSNRTHYGTAFVYIPHINEYVHNNKFKGCLNDNP